MRCDFRCGDGVRCGRGATCGVFAVTACGVACGAACGVVAVLLAVKCPVQGGTCSKSVIPNSFRNL